MNDNLFIILIGTLGFAGSLMGVLKDYRDKRYTKRRWKQIKTPGYVLIAITLSILGLTIWQYFANQRQKKQDANDFKAQNFLRDSSIKAGIRNGVDSGLDRMSKGFAASFKEQGLTIDSVNFKLSLIKDSARKVINNYPVNLPILELRDNAISVDSSMSAQTFNIKISSSQAGSTNFHLSAFTFINFKKGAPDVGRHPFILSPKTEIGVDKVDEVHITLPFKKEVDSFKFYIHGTYNGINSRVVRKIDDVYVFVSSLAKTYHYSEPVLSRVKSQIVDAYEEAMKTKAGK